MVMIRVNLRRTIECNQCSAVVAVEDNRKLYGDERDRAQLCGGCERIIRAEADVMLKATASRRDYFLNKEGEIAS